MKVAVKRGNGLFIYSCEEVPQEPHIVITTELQNKLDSIVKPDINSDFTDFVELATEEEIEQFQNADVPQVIPKMKFKLALIKNGFSIKSINTFIESIEDEQLKETIQVKFNDSDIVERNDPSLLYMAEVMQLSKEQVNQIFIYANNL